jgi:S1-C subfamily serine protease
MIRRVLTTSAALALALLAPGTSRAELPPQPKNEAPVVVEGTVREVFQSPRRTNVDYIVQIEVASAALGQSKEPIRGNVPAPGGEVYVHAFQRRPDAPNMPAPGGHRAIPAEGSRIKAYLYPRGEGGWAGAYPDWYDTLANAPAGADEVEPAAEPPSAPAGAPGMSRELQVLAQFFGLVGVTGEPVRAGNRIGYRILSLAKGSPAERAGLEKGDVVVAANGAALNDLPGLIKALQDGGGRLTLDVLDVRSGKAVPVEVDMAGAEQAEIPPAEPAPAPGRPAPAPVPAGPRARSLGIGAEPVALGLRTALKVTAVEPGSPAQKAGLEPGDVIVDADGLPVSSAESLAAALRRAGPTLTLTVRDTRSNKDTPVEVALGGEAPAAAPNAPQAPRRGLVLGVVVDPVFAGGQVALKVVEVKNGSPAQKAGLEPGDVIAEVNNRAVESQEELDAVAARSGAKYQVLVIDVRTGKRVPVDVDMNAR